RSSYATRTSVLYTSGILSPRLGLYDTHCPVGIGAIADHTASSSTPSTFGGVVVRVTRYSTGVCADACTETARSSAAVARPPIMLTWLDDPGDDWVAARHRA